MNKIYKKTSHRLIAALLIACALLSTLLLGSCNKEEAQASGEDYVTVVRAVDDISFGNRITNDKLETVTVRADSLPKDVIIDIDAVRGKFAAINVFAGDYFFASKLSDKQPTVADDDSKDPIKIDPLEQGYVVITSYKKYVEKGDYSPAIKKAMEENPRSTIYFPDGTYNFSEPIVISADPAKSVSLKLSNMAILKPLNWTDSSLALIRVGVSEDGESDTSGVAINNAYIAGNESVSITGGCIYCVGMSRGISVEGGVGTYIYNVAIKASPVGLHIKKGPNALGATYVNVDNVNITGNDSKESIGVLVEGSYNTLSNMRIASINYGVKCTETGSRNIFRNIHPLCSIQTKTTAGFWDLSDGNTYDVCYSDQFATGFLMETNTKSVYNGCFCYWWTDANDYHVGFASNGQFNSIINSSKVSHSHAGLETDAYMLVAEDGGQGVVLYPLVGNRSNAYISVLEKYCKTVRP